MAALKSHKKSSSAPLRSSPIGTNCNTCWGASELSKTLNISFTFCRYWKTAFGRSLKPTHIRTAQVFRGADDVGQENVMNLIQLWSTKIKPAINLVKQESTGKIITSPVLSCCNECRRQSKNTAGKLGLHHEAMNRYKS
uniref:Putative ftsj-like rna methyltransferase n=1 Tax=Ixodes ricinus TaxID=34613 RepID=A0A0K8RCH1_IXORI